MRPSLPKTHATLLGQIQSALQRCGVDVDEVVVTNNRVRLASRQRRQGNTVVRVAVRLLDAGPSIVEPLAGFFADDAKAKAQLTEIIAALPTVESRKRKTTLELAGDHHALPPLLDEAMGFLTRGSTPVSSAGLCEPGNQLSLFPAKAPISPGVAITWGPRRRLNRRQRGIKLGSYTPSGPSGPLIRIHPMLDSADVPSWYITFVIYHELLHHEFGVEARDSRGRRILHPPAFRARERQHPRYADAMEFEAKHLWGIVGRGRGTR